MYCENCGSEIKKTDKFCKECGYKIKDYFDNNTNANGTLTNEYSNVQNTAHSSQTAGIKTYILKLTGSVLLLFIGYAGSIKTTLFSLCTYLIGVHTGFFADHAANQEAYLNSITEINNKYFVISEIYLFVGLFLVGMMIFKKNKQNNSQKVYPKKFTFQFVLALILILEGINQIIRKFILVPIQSFVALQNTSFYEKIYLKFNFFSIIVCLILFVIGIVCLVNTIKHQKKIIIHDDRKDSNLQN